MKLRLLSALLIPLILTGCKSLNPEALANLGMQGVKVMSLTDNDIRDLSVQSCQQMDRDSKIAPASSKYTKRLNQIAKRLGNNIEGTQANYKVYLTNDANAWAMANGCIRVYSGLMDMMTDNEVEGVIGHEMGHVALGHSKKAMQVAYSTSIARDAIAATAGSTVAILTQSQLGDLAEKVINSQFSQTQESAADNYSYDFLKSKKISVTGLVSGFEKLAKLGGGKTSLLSSHPASQKRADNIKNRIAKDSK